jgi:sugar phosphate isomerase/epimerase
VEEREVALAHLSLAGVPRPTALSVAAAVGVRRVCLRLAPAHDGDPVPDVLREPGGVSRLRRQVDDAGLGVLDVEVLRLRPEDEVRDHERTLEAAAELGAAHVLVIGNDPDEDRTAERLAALCEVAEPLGVRPVLEFMAFTAVPDLAACCRVVERAGRRPGVLVDPLHLARSGGSPEDVARVAPDLVPYAQFCDAAGPRPRSNAGLAAEARERRRPPGSGELPLVDVVRALPPRAPLALEVPGPPAELASEPERWARQLLDGTRSVLRRLAV